ncbi:hypothetical protein J2Z44_003513 [Clostridium punense]|uniref:Uncharacterized protein n=2 Tax=Clostridium TaxID=1485 RepID=A0ABS4K928_9CLOT|nr:hypothetical protein [Clostridium punense]MBP2023671.1 hypothetical protein [Clostridium punense]
MKKWDKTLLIIMLLCTLIILNFPIKATANSAEPPALIILVNNPPKDLSIVLESGTVSENVRFSRRAWEGYYAFYSKEIRGLSKYKFKISTAKESFECTITEPLKEYDNVFTLDMANKQLIPGKSKLRDILLVVIRVILTLIIEGIVFWLLGFRQKRSWIIFLFINLFTQGALNFWLNWGGFVIESYLIIKLFIGEWFVFLFEVIAFPLLIKERQKATMVGYAFLANLVSLFAGGVIIAALPI